MRLHRPLRIDAPGKQHHALRRQHAEDEEGDHQLDEGKAARSLGVTPAEAGVSLLLVIPCLGRFRLSPERRGEDIHFTGLTMVSTFGDPP